MATRKWLGLIGRTIVRWWWKPSPARMLLWLPVVFIAGTLGNHSNIHDATVGEIVAEVIVVIALAPMFFTGFRLLIGATFVGPFRAWLIRRNTGRQVYFVRGQLRERRRHGRSLQKGQHGDGGEGRGRN